ncbi:MAG: type 4a pilus biogenesis protein PilO [Xanthomonadales bacterium]|nr:type 4a pilus biogenesis protein PilO [Xanthomonadales bacterium]
MNLEEFRNLDFEDPGGWPPLAKGIAAAAVVIFILVIAYFLSFKDQWQILDDKKRQEVTLKNEFEEKQQKAVNLERYEDQLAQMEEILRSLVRQLPSKTEMANLLQDVSQTAIATGIDVELFQPQPEVIKDFYAEQPISLRMVGGFHQFGEYVSAVASLARVVILTMHDIELQPLEAGRSELVLEGTVKTYRYLDEDEQAALDTGAEQ